MASIFEELLLAEQLVAELVQVNALIGTSEKLPPIKVKINGKHYQVDLTVTRID